MYIPSYLPCFKCMSGPTIYRDEDNHVQAECLCYHIKASTYGVSTLSTVFSDSEMERIAMAWNDEIINEFYDKPLR